MAINPRQITLEFKRNLLVPIIFLIVLWFFVFGVVQCVKGRLTSDSKFCYDCSDIRKDRDLVITSGDTVRMRTGEVHEYESILIQKGGVLEFYGDQPAWTTLRCKKDFKLQGKIVFTGFDPDSYDVRLDRVTTSINGTRIYE